MLDIYFCGCVFLKRSLLNFVNNIKKYTTYINIRKKTRKKYSYKLAKIIMYKKFKHVDKKVMGLRDYWYLISVSDNVFEISLPAIKSKVKKIFALNIF